MSACPRQSCRDPDIRGAGEVGSATLEISILAPGLLLIISLLVGVGRTQSAHQAVESAARDAARQASISRSPATAQQTATSSAQAALQREGLRCTPTVAIEAAGLNRPVGTQATVSATVTCQIPLSGLLIPGLPGSVRVQGRFSSPVDPYRGSG